MQFDYLVFIGRFQPYHSGHHHVATEALKLAKRLIFVIGSHDKPRDIRNPYTTDERIDFIKGCLDWKATGVLSENRVFFAPQVDYTYNDEKWIAAIQASVQAIITQTSIGTWQTGSLPSVGIVGYSKDHSSYYLKKFPQWKLVEIGPINDFSATQIREELFGEALLTKNYHRYFVDDMHRERIEGLTRHSTFDPIRQELKFVKKYKKQWEAAPYPVTFNTVDAVVTQSGHILLVQRGAQPGKGLWALPGGFLNQNETHREGVIRELYEETQIDVPRPALAGSIVKVKGYDDPHRSVRGRTLTQTFHFKLNDAFELPRIKGSDDAVNAKWFSLSEFMGMRREMFEDHFDITCDMLGL